MKLLLIEQSTVLSERLAGILADLDCVEAVETAGTIEDATRVLRPMRPEIVVMDANRPDGSGIEALARVKAEDPSVCVIVVSYDSSEPYRKRWLQAGADYCFDISIQIDQLLNAVRRLASAPASCTMAEDKRAEGDYGS